MILIRSFIIISKDTKGILCRRDSIIQKTGCDRLLQNIWKHAGHKEPTNKYLTLYQYNPLEQLHNVIR